MGKLIGGVKGTANATSQGSGSNRSVQPFTVTESLDVAGVALLAHGANFIPGDIVYLKQGETILAQGTVEQTVTSSTISTETNRLSIFWTPVTLVPSVTYSIDAPGKVRHHELVVAPYGKVLTATEMLGGASGTTDLAGDNRLYFELVDPSTRIANGEDIFVLDEDNMSLAVQTPMFLQRRFVFPPVGWGVGRTASFEYIQWPPTSVDKRADSWQSGVFTPPGSYIEPTVGQIWPR